MTPKPQANTLEDTELGLRQKIAVAVAKADVDLVMNLIALHTQKARIDEQNRIWSATQHDIIPLGSESATEEAIYIRNRYSELKETI